MRYILLCFLALLFSIPEISASYVNDFHPAPQFTQVDTTQVNSLLDEAERATISGSYSQAKELIQRADSLANVLNYPRGKEKAISYLADVYIDEGEYQTAIDLLNDALNSYPESFQLAEYYNALGSAYENIAEFDLSIQNFEKALEYTDRLPPERRDRLNAGLKQNLAAVYKSMGQNSLAFENYLEAIEYADAAKDTAMLTIVYNNLGLAYDESDEYKEAIYYYEKSLEYAELLNSKIDIYRAHINLANTLSNTERYEDALEHYEVAEALYAELRPNLPPVIILHNRGNTLAKMGQFEEAERLLNESLSLSEEMGIKEGMYYNHQVLGRIYFEQERNEEAIAHLKMAVDIAGELMNTSLLESSREVLYKTYAQANRYEDAFATLQMHKTLSDSLTDIEKEKELANLKNQLELNRQNEVNRLLQEKQVQQERKLQFQFVLIIAAALIIVLVVVILFVMRKSAREKEEILIQVKSQKEKVEELNRAKDKLFAIIAHDLRSPLSSIQGMFYLIKEGELSKEEIKSLIPELEISIQKNMNVMEDLLVWAKEQLSGVNMDFKMIPLQPLVQDVISSQKVLVDKKGISLKQNIEHDAIVKADSNALQLVIRNLISNAIKYTGKGDEIEINTRDEGEKVIIEIRDTGIGIPQKASDKIFESKSWTREGTNKEKGSGFGLNLSKEFVERMHGKIWFESTEGEGTTFYVELPKA